MTVILILIAASLAVALVFLGGFIWAVRSGQFEDTCTPSMRILTDEVDKHAVPGVPVSFSKMETPGSASISYQAGNAGDGVPTLRSNLTTIPH